MPATPLTKGANGFLDGMGLIKSISGNTEVQVERKNRDPISVKLPVVVWLANNWKVGWVRGAEDVTAWTERLIILPFDETIPAAERVLTRRADILHGDGLDTIAAFCMKAYIEAFQRGKGKRIDWTQSERSQVTLSEIVDGAAGQTVQFVSSRIAFLPDAWTSRKAIREAYRAYINRNPPRAETNLIYKHLRNYPHVRNGKRQGVDGFHGVALGEHSAEAADFGSDLSN